MGWRFSGIVASLALLNTWLPATADSAAAQGELPAPRSILYLNAEERSYPAIASLIAGFRDAVSAAGLPVVLHIEDFEVSQFQKPGYFAALQQWLRAKYRDAPPDVIVASGAEVLRQLLQFRNVLWPRVPIVFVAVDRSVVESMSLPPDVTGVVGGLDVRGTLDLALTLLPRTRRVVIVGRKVAYTHDAATQLRSEIVARRLQRIDLSDLPQADILGRLRRLPEDAIVYYRALPADDPGRMMPPARGVELVAAAATRPVFGDVGAWIGRGIVGGSILHPRALGEQAAEPVLRILGGEPVAAIPIAPRRSLTTVVDWRELERWGLDAARLPPDTVVRFRPVAVWRQHWQLALAVATVIFLQAALIAALLLERSQRRRAEAEARRQLGESAHWNRVASVGHLTTSLAHELNQPLAAILANAQAARRFLAGSPPDLGAVAETLDNIASEDRRAGAVVQRARDLMKKGPLDLLPLDLNDTVGDTIALLRHTAKRRRTTVELDLEDEIPAVLGDPVQLQQVALNLVSNALDAVAAQPESRRSIVVRTSYTAGRGVELTVRDSGGGLSATQLTHLFEPFYTTKPDGLGVGLSICRSIVEAHGGRVDAESEPGRGTTFHCLFPSIEEASA